jgi:hypothetical protein
MKADLFALVLVVLGFGLDVRRADPQPNRNL